MILGLGLSLTELKAPQRAIKFCTVHMEMLLNQSPLIRVCDAFCPVQLNDNWHIRGFQCILQCLTQLLQHQSRFSMIQSLPMISNICQWQAAFRHQVLSWKEVRFSTLGTVLTLLIKAVGMVMSSRSLAISGWSSGAAIVSSCSSRSSITKIAFAPAFSALKAFSTK